MTPDLSARVAALEARLDALERRDTVLSDVVSLASRMRVRERSRDDLIDMALGALPELLRTQWPNLADEVKRRHAVLYGDDFGADMTDRAIEYMSAAPCPPPAAPCADEVEVVARAIGEAFKQPFINDGTQLAAQAALTALSPLRQAERERAWRDGAEAMREACKRGVLGGRFLHDDAPTARFARECAEMLDRLPLPPAPGAAP